jgi:hypothetical protein
MSGRVRLQVETTEFPRLQGQHSGVLAAGYARTTRPAVPVSGTGIGCEAQVAQDDGEFLARRPVPTDEWEQEPL